MRWKGINRALEVEISFVCSKCVCVYFCGMAAAPVTLDKADHFCVHMKGKSILSDTNDCNSFPFVGRRQMCFRLTQNLFALLSHFSCNDRFGENSKMQICPVHNWPTG